MNILKKWLNPKYSIVIIILALGFVGTGVYLKKKYPKRMIKF